MVEPTPEQKADILDLLRTMTLILENAGEVGEDE